MYCPHCGNPQVSIEVQFCSSCGFPLKGVQQLLRSGGMVPQLEEGETVLQDSPQRRGIRQGALLWLIGAVLVPLFAILGAEEEFVGAMAIIFFVGGLVRMLYAWMFLNQHQTATTLTSTAPQMPPYVPPASTLHGAPPVRSLDTSPAARLNTFAQHRTTGQLVTPPSVTDHTTRLLEQQPSVPESK